MVETKVCLKMNGVGNALWLWQKKKKIYLSLFYKQKNPPKTETNKKPHNRLNP